MFTPLILNISNQGYAQTTPSVNDCNCVIFRYDDVQDGFNDQLQNKTFDLFIQKSQKVSLGIIMHALNTDQMVISKIRQGKSLGLFELDLHGWDHVDYSTLSLAEQVRTLGLANDKMEQMFGTNTNTFIAPYDHFNQDTLKAMQQLGLTIFSSSTYRDKMSLYPDSDQYGVYHMPETITFPDKPVSQLITEAKDSIQKYGFAIYVVHPQDFRSNGVNNVMNQTQYNILSDLIDQLVRNNRAIVTFNDLSAISIKSYDISSPNVSIIASPPGGTYNSPQSVNLTSNKLGMTVYYTLDGSTPTSSSPIYREPIPLSSTTTLKFFGRDAAGNIGTVITQEYAIRATGGTGGAGTQTMTPRGSLYLVVQSLTLKGTPTNIDILSSSRISSFTLDEANKKILFQVEGQTGSRSTTIIPVSKMLLGPYFVTFDGSTTNDFQVARDQATGQDIITLSYSPGVHQITIAGTNVVPEFPVAVMGTVAVIIGLIAILGRTNMFRSW